MDWCSVGVHGSTGGSQYYIPNRLGFVPPDWLAVRLLYEVAVRPIYFFKQEPFVAAVLDVRTTRLIERSAWELMQDGFSLEGFYVGS
jgi:hypothetical protein